MCTKQMLLWIPSNNYFTHREGHRPRWIIIHGIAGFPGAQDVGYYFPHADVATYYIIGRDGTVVQTVRLVPQNGYLLAFYL